jgi:hypothetical protein
MLIRVRTDLAFEIANQAQAIALRDAIVPFYTHAVVINEGEDNEERGYISAENCGHDEDPPVPCVEIARWEVGRGRVV